MPCGVFSWSPPAALVTDLSDLLAEVRHDRPSDLAGRAATSRSPAGAGDRPARRLQPPRRARRRRRARRHPARPRSARRPTSAVLLAVALTVRALRHGSVCLDLATVAQVTAVDGADRAVVARCRGPSRPPGRRPGGQPAGRGRRRRRCGPPAAAAWAGCSTSTATGARSSCIADMLDRARRTAAPDGRPGRVADAVARLFPAEDARPAAAGGRGGGPPVGQRARRRPRHRQDHHRREAARGAGRPGRRPAAGGDGRADRQGRGPADRGGGRRDVAAWTPATGTGSAP